jgi:outer membrane protein TolC
LWFAGSGECWYFLLFEQVYQMYARWSILLAGLLACAGPYPSQGAEENESLAWNVCVDEALGSNPEILAAQEATSQALAGTTIARSSLLPTLSATIGGNRYDPAGESYSCGLSARQLLYDGGRTKSRVEQSEAVAAASLFDYQVASAGVRFRLRTGFVNLLKAQESVSITSGILERRRQTTTLIRLRHEAGREHKGALLTAEAREAQAELEVAQAHRSLETAQVEMLAALGRPSGDLAAAAAADEDAHCIVAQGKLDAAVVNCPPKPDFALLAGETPQVAALTSRVEQARMSVTAARADFAPSVYLSASATGSGAEWPPDDENWSVGISVSLPIYSGGSRVAQVAKAKSARRAAELSEKNGKNNAIAELHARWTELQNAVDNATVQRKFLDAARERAQISEAQYSTGLVSFDNWIIIEDDFVRAQKAFLDAQAAALVAEAGWIRAKGGSLEDE